ncbi:LuxR C-terminal-related transcriptional regulator [Lutibacter sp. Hel_I_33_5]|uniref:LuxR C-terminal-related transcriptional regulator n=1 Tax=Lutibacter sp. Hel_I_33_5 TaxID=1566289 RepID=UPI001646C20D|nr:LuxR C-terminal-related transcriptional regulator [Lutibacter sp. Hel_I_33_5]
MKAAICFSQADISYYQDKEGELSFKDVDNYDFIPYDKIINKGLDGGVYWFKITDFSEDENIIQFKSSHIFNAEAYHNGAILNRESHERFVTFKVKKNEKLLIKLKLEKEAFIPVEVFSAKGYKFKEKVNLLIIGLYYGFALFIVLVNIIYSLSFKDKTFLFYGLFVFCVSCSLSFSDGLLILFNVSQDIMDFIILFIHTIGTIFGVTFATKYLGLENYYPKIRYLILFFGAVFVFLFILYFSTGNFIYFALVETATVVFLTFFWFLAVTLFKKDLFIRIFVIAYFFMVIFGLDYYVARLFGFSVLNFSSDIIKVAGFFEMLLFSFALVYRMKILHEQNKQMRFDIETLIVESSNEISNEVINDNKLSVREKEILEFINKGKKNKEIADELNISVNTVKYHIKNIYEALNIKNRKEAIAFVNK